MGKIYLIIVFSILTVGVFAQELSLQEHFTSAQEAYKIKNYEAYLEHLRSANELRPNHPTIVYKLAGAWALNKRKTRSIQTLNQMLLMDATVDFNGDPDFENIKDSKGYDRLLDFQKTIASVEIHDEVFIKINAADLHPESFVMLPDGTFLLGSIREKRIVKVGEDGSYTNWLQTPYSVMGMKLSRDQKHLWVATAALPEMLGYELEMKGKSEILQIDLSTGLVVQGLEYDVDALIGDLVPDKENRLWLSNSIDAHLSRDDTDTSAYLGAFTRLSFDLNENFFNLQGLTLNDEETHLYFSDYIKGLFRVDINTGAIDPLFAPKTSLLKGIDGLYYYKNSLIAIHNGTKPYRVVQYILSENGSYIELERVINRGGDSLGEPTLGQIKDGYFYYLANSPWQAYHNGMLMVENWGPIEIRRIKLD